MSVRKSFLLSFFAVLCLHFSSYAQSELKWVEASSLNLIGKAFENTPNPYHRVDTVVYKGFNRTENRQVRCSAGIAILFKTNTRAIEVTTRWGYVYGGTSTMPISYKGYDLYIKDENGKWQYAASGTSKTYRRGDKKETFPLIFTMDGTMHECMLYMPMYSEVLSCQIGVDADAVIEPLQSEFRHKIAIYGSSYTQGVGTDRAGMSYPMQFMRNTGLQIVSLATSGRCRMQPYMADVLADVEADAYIFDTFSNPDAETIRERLIPFLDRMVEAHPGKPLIFQRTIYQECRCFEKEIDEFDKAKEDVVEEMFKAILKDPRYKDVYLITPKAAVSHDNTVDGTHPNSYGYSLWAKSIEKPVLKILRKYGIR
ncbi:MAG: SGNH/GDSL hydrolase family protein [Bacteroidales bacterium]|nr:SGNH/GDSL hydrolase family protein [Bacteroidales bacterium]